MAQIIEHPVDMKLAGKPRWWTVKTTHGTFEVVRADYTNKDERLLCFIVLEPGQYAWPPLVAAAMQGGELFFEQLKEMGGKWIPYDSEEGKKLELMLAGVKR